MKICCVFNYNPLYNFAIYNEMSKQLECDFFFGDSVFAPLKQFDEKKLKGFQTYLHAKLIYKDFIWFCKPTKTLNKKYSHYLLTGTYFLLINWIIIVYAKITRKKVFCWTHGPKRRVDNWKGRILSKLFYKSMDGIYVYNNYNTKFIEELGVKSSRIHVIYNSMDTHHQSMIYSTLKPSAVYKNHFKNDDPVLIFIGRIQKRMKVHYLIEALEILQEQGINVNITLVGPYVDGEDISGLVDKKELSNRVWFFGPSYNEETTSELLYNADVCIAPGTVGLTAIHSLTYGTPCITHGNVSDIGPEWESIIDGVTGSFFEEDNVNDLVRCIKLWINKSEDERNNIRIAARNEILKKWNVDTQISILKETLK